MELNFDKEIDAILRKAQPSGGAGGFLSHLDADEVSAFAENALPENTKARCTAHLADCERCRKILVGLIALNSESVGETFYAAAPAAAAIPWYRKFLAFPNLAYSLGAIALVFGALIVFTILQSTTMENAEVSQMKPSVRENAPMPADMPANSAANPATNSTTLERAMPASNVAPQAATNTKSVSDFSCQDCGSPSENETKPADEKDRDLAKIAIDGASGETVKDKEKRADAEEKNTDDAVRTERQLPAPATTTGAVKDAPKKSQAKADSGATKSVGGKIFRRQDAAWVDSAYQSGSNMQLPPLNYVSRGSGEYKKLDGGLRDIAESLDGVVIVVWKKKAYRIQ